MILIDENLSYKLAARLDGLFPGIKAVTKTKALGEGTKDKKVWSYAKENHLAILTVDKDFEEFYRRFGPPPKVIRLMVGNERVTATEILIKNNATQIKQFFNSETGFLLIRR